MLGSTLQLSSHSNTTSHQETNADNESERRRVAQQEVAYSIVHAVAGRVGFCVPRIAEDPEYVQRLQELVEAEPFVCSQEVNPNPGSIVINYQTQENSDLEMRSRLSILIQRASQPDVVPEVVTVSATASSLREDSVVPNTKADAFGVDNSGEMGILGGKKNLAGETPTPQDSPVTHPDEKTHQLAKQPRKVSFKIAHAIPGRVRFRIPRIAQDPKYVQRLEALLKADTCVVSERVNSAAASVVITYRSEGLSHLASLIQLANG